MSSPLSIRVSDNFKEKYQKEAENSGMKQEEFLQTLLESYKDTSEEESAEKKQIRAKAEQIVKLTCAIIDRAQDQENTAIESVAKIQIDCSDQIAEQKQLIDELSTKNSLLEAENRQLLEKQENVTSWKDLLKEKEKILIDTENENQKLKDSVENLKSKINQDQIEHKNNEIRLMAEFEEKLRKTFQNTIAEIKKES